MLLHAIVRGRVQGVGFRYFVLEKARALHLAGWVKNRPDRTVEVEAEGDEDALQQLEQILWKGPTLSRVEDVKTNYSDNVRGHRGFQIG